MIISDFVILICLILSAFFSGMEIAFVSANKIYLEIEKQQTGFNAKFLNFITKNPSRFIATMLVGNNISLVIYGIFMGDRILQLLFLEILLGGANSIQIVFIQTVISTIIILLTAEFLPKVFFQQFSNVLMKLLLSLRKEVATLGEIPPYAVFQEYSLEDMCLKYPITEEELVNINGVGEGKAKRYGKKFLDLIQKYIEENQITRPDDLVVKSTGINSSIKLYLIQSIDRKLPFDDIAAAFATVAFVAFISLLVDRTYTATQYALLASIGTAGRTTLASSSGALVDWLNGDWGTFFILTAIMVIPSLICLWIIKDKLKLSEK